MVIEHQRQNKKVKPVQNNKKHQPQFYHFQLPYQVKIHPVFLFRIIVSRKTPIQTRVLKTQSTKKLNCYNRNHRKFFFE